jgi:hypothetical protein
LNWTATGAGAAFRHVGRLVPVQHVARRIQIADFAQKSMLMIGSVTMLLDRRATRD